MFKQILKERHTVLQWFQIDPGDGTQLSFWQDPWTKFGQLISFVGNNGPRLTGIPLRASVADAWREGGWRIHSARSREIEELLIYLTTISLSDSPSSPWWIFEGKTQKSFSSSQVYHSLLQPLPKVPWYPIIWIKKGIPKHMTLAWLMFLNISPTRDRLLAWGLQTDPLCLLCNRENESRNHLFFSCSYSAEVWTHFSLRFGINPISSSWDDTARSLLSQTGSKHKKFLSILTWQATIYDLWWERNDRLHRGNFKSPHRIISKVSFTIKNRISSLRPERNSLASELIQLWFVLFPA